MVGYDPAPRRLSHTEDVMTGAVMDRPAGTSPDRITRVLFVLQSYVLGGMETVAADLGVELARRGIAVCIVIPDEPALHSFADHCRNQGVHVERITTDGRHGFLGLGLGLARFARLLRAWRPDIVHLNPGGATGGAGVIVTVRLVSSAITI